MFNLHIFRKPVAQTPAPTMPEPMSKIAYLNVLHSDALLALKIGNYRAYDWSLNEYLYVKPLSGKQYAQYCAQRWNNYVLSTKGI